MEEAERDQHNVCIKRRSKKDREEIGDLERKRKGRKQKASETKISRKGQKQEIYKREKREERKILQNKNGNKILNTKKKNL